MQYLAHPQATGVSSATTSNVDDLQHHFFSPSTLDASSEHSPDMADSRRESFATGPPLFSPKTEEWQSVDMQSIPSNNPYTADHHELPNYTAAAHAFNTPSTNVWGMAGQATSLPQFDPAVAAGFDAPVSLYQNSTHAPMPFPSSMFGSMPGEAQQDHASPKSDWAATSQSMNQKSVNVDGEQMPQNELRRDSVRKRNARFDIPPEHNLNNIDQLIAESTNELEIKELKQQKRLLRNRQAA